MKLRNIGRTSFTLLLVVLLVSSGIVAAVGGSVGWSSDPAPNTEYAREETKAVHNMTWGTSDDALRQYENNNGDLVSMEAEINDSADNPVSFVPTDIEIDELATFPHAKDGVAATDASEWSVDTSGVSTSGATADVSNAETAPGVEAVRFNTADLTSGDTAKYTFDNFSITSDENKHNLVVGEDIATLDSGAVVEYRVVDEDGDYKAAEINTTRSSGDDYMANATGEGYLYQEQLGNLELEGSGDGTFNNIEKVVVVVEDGDYDGSVPYLNLDSMSPYQFGTEKTDTDGDDSLETVNHVEKKTAGPVSVTGLDTLGGAFDSAAIHSVTMDVIEEPADQPDANVFLNTTETDKYPGYAGTATIAVRMQAEDAYDRSISNAVLRDTQSVTSDRVISVEYAEGVPDEEAVDQAYLDNRSLSDMTAQYGSEGKEVQLDASLSKGSAALAVYEYKVTEDQMTALEATSGGDGSGSTGAKSGGGVGSIPLIGGLLVALLGIFRRFGG